MIRLTAAILFFYSNFLYAGGITSGGGFIYSDEINPWFLENTKKVTYCIEIDEEKFGTTKNSVRAAITSALVKWKKALREATHYPHLELEPAYNPQLNVRIGTQQFVESTECHPEVDIKFQMGVMTPKQIKEYNFNSKRTIAQTIRTSYDEVNLQAKGIIYVAPARGEFRPTEMEMAENPWDVLDGLILERVISHELGHIFGVAHFGTHRDLMGSQHTEFAVQKKFVERLLSDPIGLSFAKQLWESVDIFAVDSVRFEFRSYCDSYIGNLYKSLFDSTSGAKCLRLSLQNHFITVYEKFEEDGDNWLELGKMKISEPNRSYNYYGNVIIRVKLPKDQKVFTKWKELETGTNTLPAVLRQPYREFYETTYTSKNGFTRNFSGTVWLSSDMTEIRKLNFLILDEGKIKREFFFNPVPM